MTFRSDILHILDSASTEPVLFVMPATGSVIAEALNAFPDLNYRIASGDEILANALPDTQRFRMAIVADTLEHMTRHEGEMLIAKLRDVLASTLYALTPSDEPDSDPHTHYNQNDMLALGLRLVKHYDQDNNPYALYYFDLYDYKTTPDWLNSKHWANPQRWNKSRW